MPLERPTSVNGFYFDQTSVRVTALGVPLSEGLVDVTFSQTLTPSVIRGRHPVRLGRGLGTLEAAAEITLVEEYWQRLLRACARRGGAVALTLLEPFLINFVPIIGAEMVNISLLGARLLGPRFGGAPANGNAGLVRQIPIDLDEIDENGIKMIPQRLP